jgi:CheY-like chemotaxis protein
MNDMIHGIGKTRYILVVDRNVNERFTMSMLLQRFGYTVATASTNEEAIDYLCVAPAVAIFAEAGEADRDLVSILSADERFFEVPIVIITDRDDDRLKQMLIKGSVSGLLQKPLDAEEVFKVIQVVIEQGTRRNIRVGTTLPALIRDGDDQETGFVTILSQHGMFFRTLAPRPAKSQLTVEFEVWDRTIRVTATVLYIVTFEEGPFSEPGMGMKFMKISAENSALIRAFIIDQLCGGIGPLESSLGTHGGSA